MPTIIPRWEWRTFGARFGRADAAFEALPQTGFQESDEVYLLSGGPCNVKIRDNLMDIKVLRETDADGLERWEPIMKASFPLTQEQARATTEALAIAAPPNDGRTWTLDAFLKEYAGPGGPIRKVDVHKRRVRYVVNDCTSEVSDVTVDGRPIRTIAIESENASQVVAGVASVGLTGYRNISYPKGLAGVLDGAVARYGVIDVGSNSVKFFMAESGQGGSWKSLDDRAEITRLGEHLAQRGVITDAAIERTAEAIKGMADEAQKVDALATIAVGTAALRLATNANAVVADIYKRTGVTIEIISGDEESRLGYMAAVSASDGVKAGSVVVFETGGGSSQFTFGRGPTVDERFSVNVGAASYTEQFGLDHAVDGDRLDRAKAAIGADLADLQGRTPPDRLIGMGGAITNLTAVALGLSKYDPNKVQGFTLERAEVDRQIERFARLDADARRTIVGLQPKRAEVILAGACIVRMVMELLAQTSLSVSDRGLRHGLMVERFGAESAPRKES